MTEQKDIKMKDSFYNPEELKALGFKSIGTNVLVSRFARFYYHEDIEIGNNVRIDDFCILSGTIKLGSNIHISAHTSLYGRFGIELEDYTGISPKCTLFSGSDDFSGDYLIGPMIDQRFTNVHEGKILMKKYSQIASNTIVMPSVTIGEGVVVGALSLVKDDLDPWRIYGGVPARFLRERSKKLLRFIF